VGLTEEVAAIDDLRAWKVKNRRQATDDLMWALLNCNEFLLNPQGDSEELADVKLV
jgi:hypothetical protein